MQNIELLRASPTVWYITCHPSKFGKTSKNQSPTVCQSDLPKFAGCHPSVPRAYICACESDCVSLLARLRLLFPRGRGIFLSFPRDRGATPPLLLPASVLAISAPTPASVVASSLHHAPKSWPRPLVVLAHR